MADTPQTSGTPSNDTAVGLVAPAQQQDLTLSYNGDQGQQPPPPPPGFDTPVSAQQSAPPPPPPGFDTPVSSMPTAAPTPQASTPAAAPEQPGVLARVGLDPTADLDQSGSMGTPLGEVLEKQLTTPADLAEQFVNQYEAGQHGAALRTALKALPMLDPLTASGKALSDMLTSGVVNLTKAAGDKYKQTQAAFQKNKSDGKGTLESALDTGDQIVSAPLREAVKSIPGRVRKGWQDAEQAYAEDRDRFGQDVHGGNYAGAAGDLLHRGMAMVPGAKSLVGDKAVDNANEDLHNHNLSGLVGDAVAGATNVLATVGDPETAFKSVFGGAGRAAAEASPILEGANAYNAAHGRPPITPDPRYLMQDRRAPAIADAFDAMAHNPNDPAVKASYDAAKKEIKDQFDHITQNMGIKVEPWNGADGTQPYADSAAMRADVHNNKHLYFFRGGDMPLDHPLAEIAGTHNGDALTYNDMLRADHDIFGHAIHSNEFGARGEENAWRDHSQMFSDDALPAITTETKGQNSWVNAGKHLRRGAGSPYGEEGSLPVKGDPDWVPRSKRPYADQKAGLLPPEYWSRDIADGMNFHTNHDNTPLNEWAAMARSRAPEFSKKYKGVMARITRSLGMDAEYRTGVGMYENAPEPSMVTRVKGTHDIDTLMADAAMKGKAAGQKEVLFWHNSADGPDTAQRLFFKQDPAIVLRRAKVAGYDKAFAEELPSGDTLLHIYTMGGDAPKETIDELAERLGADRNTTIESRGHGLGIKERDYDNIIKGREERRNPSHGSGNIPVNGVPHGPAQKGNQGRLATAAQTVRDLSQRGKTVIPAQGVADVLGKQLTDAKAKVDAAFESATSNAAAEQATAAQGVGEKTAQAKAGVEAATTKKLDGLAQTLERRQNEIAHGLSAARQGNQNTLETTLRAAAPNAVEPEELAGKFNEGLNEAEADSHTNYENGLNDEENGVIPRLDGETAPVQGSNSSKQARKILNSPNPADHPLVAGMKNVAGDKLDAKVKNFLTELSEGTITTGEGDDAVTEPMADFTAKDLVALRQSTREAMSGYMRGDINRRALGSMIEAIDKDLETMAKSSGDEDVIGDYAALRNQYRIARANLDSSTADKLMLDKPDQAMDDLNKYLLGGNNAQAKIEVLRNLGKGGLIQEAAATKVQQWAKNVDQFMKDWPKMAQPLKEAFFGPKLAKTLQDAADTYKGASEYAENYAAQANDVAKAANKGVVRNAKAQGDLLTNQVAAGGKAEMDAVNDKYRAAVDEAAEKRDAANAPFSNTRGSLLKSLAEGRINDDLFKGNVQVQDVQNIKKVIGQDKWNDISDGILQRGIADSLAKNGTFDPEKFMDWWNGMDENVRREMFSTDQPEFAHNYQAMLDSIGDAAAVKQKFRRITGAVAGLGAMGAASQIDSTVAEALGAMAGGAGLFKKGKYARQLTDYVANTPAAWKVIEKAGKAGGIPRAAAGAVKGAAKVVGNAAGKAVASPAGKAVLAKTGPAMKIASAYAGANNALGGNDKKKP